MRERNSMQSWKRKCREQSKTTQEIQQDNPRPTAFSTVANTGGAKKELGVFVRVVIFSLIAENQIHLI